MSTANNTSNDLLSEPWERFSDECDHDPAITSAADNVDPTAIVARLVAVLEAGDGMVAMLRMNLQDASRRRLLGQAPPNPHEAESLLWDAAEEWQAAMEAIEPDLPIWAAALGASDQAAPQA